MSLIETTFPLHIVQKNGKKVAISGSWYRNAHFHSANNIKKRYTEEIAVPQLKSHSPMSGVAFSLYVLYKPNKKRLDTDNYTSVHMKFYNDSLTQCGIIVDDDTDHVPINIGCYGGIDKENPRVDVYTSEDLEEIIELMREKRWKIN